MKDYENLKQIANEMRMLVVDSIFHAKSGHPGGSLSVCEIIATLFFEKMNVDANNPNDPNRDRFVLSKGHAAPTYYAALALKGFFPKEDMKTLRKVDSYLQGHPCMNKVKGVDMSSGSLGQGLSAGNGMAICGKYDKKDYHVFCVAGDGELQEGQIWEAAMTSAHYKLDNLTLFVDNNGMQIDGTTDEVMGLLNIGDKFNAFGWNVLNVDGHNFQELDEAIEKARACKGKPTVIICKTIKGKGVSFMEHALNFHGAAPNEEQYHIAMEELRKGVSL